MSRSRLRPRVVGAAALAVIGTCGALLMLVPSRSASLTSRSNWDLATALPSYGDFPADWNYTLEGAVRRAAPANNAAPGHPGAQAPPSVYVRAECQSTKVLSVSTVSP